MTLTAIYFPYVVSFLTGYLLLHLLFYKKEDMDRALKIFLAGGLGFGINASMTFLSFVLFDKFIPHFVIGINCVILGIFAAFAWLTASRKLLPSVVVSSSLHRKGVFSSIHSFILSYAVKSKTNSSPKDPAAFQNLWPYLLLALAAIPLWYQAWFFVNGGWDAWETWNLKAKFLFLGGEHWKNIFSPLLWRSSPHYPLLLPLINVWGWSFMKEPILDVPVLTAFIFTLLTVGLLFAGLKKLTSSLYAILPSLVLLTLPIFDKLAYSQYSDIILAYYLLATIFCLVTAKEKNSFLWAFLAGLLNGFLSFTKTEGFVASFLLGLITIFYLMGNKQKMEYKKLILFFAIGMCVASLPTLIFHVFYAPHNITFINGLFSQTNPSTLQRLTIILGFYFFEIAAPVWNIIVFVKQNGFYLEPKWHGLWIISLIWLIVSFKRCFHPRIILIPVFLFFYSLIFTLYYFTNTYFEIGWWLQVTLHRVLFALLPTVLFWTFYSVFHRPEE